MGMTEQIESNTMYLYIIAGTMMQKVTEETTGAVRRDWKLKDGTSGIKWEKLHKNLKGFISAVEFQDGKYGQQCQFKMTNGKDKTVLSFTVDSRYFFDLAKKFANIELNEQITINPYDFAGDNEKE